MEMNEMTQREQFDPVSLEIMWSRMLNVAEEMWSTVLRTAVSTIIASANDFGCEVLDAEGRSIAHAYRSMPVFNMTMPNVTKEILKKYPVETMHPDDVYMTNDPWMCAGHLPDIAIVSPVFYQGRFVGFVGNIANTSDIGGTLDLKRVTDSYEEGLFFPLCKLYDKGEPNELAFDMYRWNVRGPEMVLTDIEAQVAANQVGARRINDFLDEYGLEDLAALSAAIRGRSEAAMRRAIEELPDGVYENHVYTDGMGDPLKIQARQRRWRAQDAAHHLCGAEERKALPRPHRRLRRADGQAQRPVRCASLYIRQGHWVQRWSIGGVLEGPYVDGKKRGHWVWRWPDGQVREPEYRNGEQVR